MPKVDRPGDVPVALDPTVLRARPVEPSDLELLWRWANDPLVRRNSLSPQDIPLKSHTEWFHHKIVSPDTRIYMVELAGDPVGQVRYDRTGADEAEIDISVAAEQRGLGLGTCAMVLTREMARKDLGVARVVGVVVASNAASCAAFRKAGFVEGEQIRMKGQLCKVFGWPPQ